MKKIITLLAILLFSSTIYAGHEAGGVIITYKGISGQPLKYLVTVRGIHSSTFLAPPTSLSLDVSSSCFVTQSVNLPRTSNVTNGTIPIQGSNYCSVTPVHNWGIAVYEDTITIPSHCADVRFSTASGAGRFDYVQNLQSNFDTPYFFAEVNTTLGSNTSPQVELFDIVQATCLNKNINYYGFSDSEGDSLYFEKSTTEKMSGSSVVNFAYATGYSKNRPLGSATPYLLNSATGAIQSQVTNIGM